MLIDHHHQQVSVRRQCCLLGLSRSTLYYKPQAIDSMTQGLMKAIDEGYTRYPFYGTRRMSVHLQRQGYEVNRKRVQRIYKLLGLEAVYPKPKTSEANKQHKVYPYLLTDVAIKRVHQVYSTDITYIRLLKGFVYLMAIMDWYSRYVIKWAVSTSLDVKCQPGFPVGDNIDCRF